MARDLSDRLLRALSQPSLTDGSCIIIASIIPDSLPVSPPRHIGAGLDRYAPPGDTNAFPFWGAPVVDPEAGCAHNQHLHPLVELLEAYYIYYIY